MSLNVGLSIDNICNSTQGFIIQRGGKLGSLQEFDSEAKSSGRLGRRDVPNQGLIYHNLNHHFGKISKMNSCQFQILCFVGCT